MTQGEAGRMYVSGSLQCSQQGGMVVAQAPCDTLLLHACRWQCPESRIPQSAGMYPAVEFAAHSTAPPPPHPASHAVAERRVSDALALLRRLEKLLQRFVAAADATDPAQQVRDLFGHIRGS